MDGPPREANRLSTDTFFGVVEEGPARTCSVVAAPFDGVGASFENSMSSSDWPPRGPWFVAIA